MQDLESEKIFYVRRGNEFISLHFRQEPSDEMLAQIMKEVAQDAKERQERATAAYFSEMRRNAEAKKSKWADRINEVIND